MRYRELVLSVMGLCLAACQTTSQTPHTSLFPPLKSAPLCENDLAVISTEHATANISECAVSGGADFQMTIRPENTPINDSAWYGFRVDPKQAGNIRIRMQYEDGKHRYRPKISHDGEIWERVPDDQVTKNSKNDIELRLSVGSTPFFVSAQEIFTKEAHDLWSEQIAEMPHVSILEIGQSVDGHPITMLEVRTEPTRKKPYVMWVGRQHPPEVTGALALIPFTETVLGNSDLANAFRATFDILIVPNMNPDGVTVGNWRHNKNGIDLNRDWGPFTQPETQAVKTVLDRFENGEDRIAFFLDFHSTWRNLLYTQTDDEQTSPPLFARDWIMAVDARLDDETYAFTREPRPMSDRAISKNYLYSQFGISAITFEVGDQTDRAAIKTAAKVFAEEMMRLLLEHEKKS